VGKSGKYMEFKKDRHIEDGKERVRKVNKSRNVGKGKKGERRGREVDKWSKRR
jgi:hypothetical protein